jgi:hypothetical protein
MNYHDCNPRILYIYTRWDSVIEKQGDHIEGL